MKKFQNILIVSDIDGTLVSADGIPQRNLDRLREFCDGGGLFTLSTGRNHKELGFMTDALKDLIRIPISVCNGSTLFDLQTEEFIHSQYIDNTHLEALFAFLTETFPGKIRFHSASDESGFLFRKDVTVSDLMSKNLFKLLFIADANEIRDIHAKTIEKFGEYFTFTLSAAINFEVLPLGSSKKSQFPYLKACYKNPHIWAIGDYDNDIEMLLGADVSVCPENATDTVKAVAVHKVCHCKDGALADMIDLIASRYS